MALVIGLAVAGVHADEPKAAPEALTLRAQIHVLKSENAQLRALLADAQAKLASAQLTAERADLEREIRASLGCAADAPINWQAFAENGNGPACAPQSPAKPQP